MNQATNNPVRINLLGNPNGLQKILQSVDICLEVCSPLEQPFLLVRNFFLFNTLLCNLFLGRRVHIC
jgi:hypothetical protein